MVVPLIRPGSNDAETRGRGSDWVWHHSWRASPLKVGKRGGPLWGSSRRAIGKPLEKTLTSSKLLGVGISRCRTPTSTARGPITSPALSRRCPPSLASWALKSMRSRRCELDERTSGPLTVQQKVPLKTFVFYRWCILLNHLRSWDWGIYSPKALCRQAGLTFCLWCGKEGQNEGTVVNHLWMSHYHLGLVYSQCLKYFTTSTDTMCCHSYLCKLASAGVDDDDDQEEESNSDDNGKDDFMFS